MQHSSRCTRLPAYLVFTILALLGLASLPSATRRTRAVNQLAKQSAQSVNGKIAFTSDSLLYTMNADGLGQLQLTSDGNNHSPAWSPDGSKIAFSRLGPQDTRTNIYLVNPDGSGLQ